MPTTWAMGMYEGSCPAMMKVYKDCCGNDLETWQAFERVPGFTADGSLRWHGGRHRRLRKVPFSMPSYDH